MRTELVKHILLEFLEITPTDTDAIAALQERVRAVLAGKGTAPEHLTASDIAAIFQVDLKTVHNWTERKGLPSFRTPGRHLRFRRSDVIDYAKKYKYPLPEWLTSGGPAPASSSTS